MKGERQPTRGAGGLARLRVTEARDRLRRLEAMGSPQPATRLARAELVTAVSAALEAGVELEPWQLLPSQRPGEIVPVEGDPRERRA
jgi:hypothetical protein